LEESISLELKTQEKMSLLMLLAHLPYNNWATNHSNLEEETTSPHHNNHNKEDNKLNKEDNYHKSTEPNHLKLEPNHLKLEPNHLKMELNFHKMELYHHKMELNFHKTLLLFQKLECYNYLLLLHSLPQESPQKILDYQVMLKVELVLIQLESGNSIIYYILIYK
jgi:hypothetical protein